MPEKMQDEISQQKQEGKNNSSKVQTVRKRAAYLLHSQVSARAQNVGT